MSDPRAALADRLITETTAALETLSVVVGLELGLYRTLRESGPAGYAELAARAGVHPRYAREWLEQQAAAGYLECLDVTASAEERRFRLSDAHAEVLLDPDSPYYLGSCPPFLVGMVEVLDLLLAAYRTGGGVPYHAYGRHIRHGIAGLNRPIFLHEYVTTWVPAVPGLAERLRGGAEVLDLGCGLGASSIALARAFPRVRVTGVDLDEASVAEARDAAAEAGVADRVSFLVGDAAAPPVAGPFDLITIFEALHDIGDPVGTLKSAHALLAPGGTVLVADERVADEFTTEAELLERFQFACSVLHCLPATMAENPVHAHGTILRTPTVREWAHAVGFADFEVLPIDFPFWKIYRMSA